MAEEISSETTRKYDHLFRDWVDKISQKQRIKYVLEFLALVKGCLTHMLGKIHIMTNPYGL